MGRDRSLREGEPRLPEGLRRRHRQVPDLLIDNDKAAWGPDSDNAKVLAKLLGGTPQDQASALKNLSLLPIDAQISDFWLGGGEKSGLAGILKDTSVFLKDQKKISDVLPSYAAFVTTDAITPLKKPGT